MSDTFAIIGFAALIMVFISASKYNLGGVWKKLFAVSSVTFLAILAADMAFDIIPAEQSAPKAAPVVEQPKQKPKPQVNRPEKSYMSKSRAAIEEKTGLHVTDSWMFEYSEYIDVKGDINTHGFIELNSDGVKRQYWLLFDGRTDQILRVKIDDALIYTAIGW